MCTYLLRFKDAQFVGLFIERILGLKQYYLKCLQQKFSDELILEPYIDWQKKGNGFPYEYKVRDIAQHDSAFIKSSDGSWVFLGPAKIYAEITGPKGTFVSTRLIICSEQFQHIVLLNAELQPETLKMRKNDGYVEVRVCSGSKKTDFRFDDTGDLQAKLREETDLSEETFQKAMQEHNEEVKKEQDLLSKSVAELAKQYDEDFTITRKQDLKTPHSLVPAPSEETIPEERPKAQYEHWNSRYRSEIDKNARDNLKAFKQLMERVHLNNALKQEIAQVEKTKKRPSLAWQ
jgi:hypothetical protein